jgi:hypothetical protein
MAASSSTTRIERVTVVQPCPVSGRGGKRDRHGRTGARTALDGDVALMLADDLAADEHPEAEVTGALLGRGEDRRADRLSADMPQPVSRNSTRTACSSLAAAMARSPPDSAAFRMRLMKTCNT